VPEKKRSSLGAAKASRGAARAQRRRAIVVGAGVFGSWTAEHLRREGWSVLLVDRLGAGNAQASSGGESRLTRSDYGPDEIYARMAMSSLAEWKLLSDRSALPLFHPHGVLFFFSEMLSYARASIDVHARLHVPLEVLDRAALSARWPQIDFTGIEVGLYEPGFGALMARRAVQELVRGFVARGGEYRLAQAEPRANGHEVRLNGELSSADAVIYACGPWLGKVFPDLLAERLFVTRQEVAFVAPPEGDTRFEPTDLPGWVDFNGGDLYYGFPNLEGRGFKIAHDAHGPPFNPDGGDRRMSDKGMSLLRAFIARRFPALAAQPFTEFRVCQYENTSNGDFLIDRHPTLEGAYLLGGGSGHGFKHGPEVGRAMALLVANGSPPDVRFSFATKETVHKRTVI
jgi:glycine/D-amino acid oxidase-like deaminating enzyme